MKQREPIGYVIATVRMPLYEGDQYDRESWDWFIFEEPAIDYTAAGGIGVARRDCQTIESHVKLVGPKK